MSHRLGGGWWHALVIDPAGQVWSWGLNDHGQVGRSADTEYIFVPERVQGLSDVVSVSGNLWNSLALTRDGKVYAWGNDSDAALGPREAGVPTYTPAQVLDLPPMVAIAAGGYFSAALDASGSVWAWGNNEAGQLGDGTFDSRRTPQKTLPFGRVTQISVEFAHVLALTDDGQVWAWGYGVQGQVIPGSDNHSRPLMVEDTPGMTGVAATMEGSFSVTETGDVWAWGMIGFEQAEEDILPSLLSGPQDITYLRCGKTTQFAVDSQNRLWGWGDNQAGQVGVGQSSYQVDTATLIQLEVPLAEIDPGYTYTVALDTQDDLWVWGGLGEIDSPAPAFLGAPWKEAKPLP